MIPKQPPMFSRFESVKVFMTPRTMKAATAILVLLIAPVQAGRFLRPEPPARGPSPLPVPPLAETTEIAGWNPLAEVLNTIPPPGPNQKRSGKCNPKAAQVEINGGCWVKTETPRPCPEGIQWEHDDGRCYLPVAEAKPVPQAAEPFRVNVAGEP
jgi:hypothetical protein